MGLPRPARHVFAAVVGIAAGAATWAQIGPVEPSLDLRTERTADPAVWRLVVTARGDETIDEVSVGAARGGLTLVGETAARGLARGGSAQFTIRVSEGADVARCAVRVEQSGPTPRTYEVGLREEP